MKRILSAVALALLSSCALGLLAQVQTTYTFSSYTGSFTPLSNPINVVVGNYDDQVYVLPNLPTYQYNGTSYTALTVSGNGCVIPGNVPSPGMLYTPLSAQNNLSAVISPLGFDLQSATIGSSIAYEVSDQEIVVQWLGAKRFGVAGESFDFQLRIDLTTQAIRFVYGAFNNLSQIGSNPQVGLRGASMSDFVNRSVTTGMMWTNSVEGSSITATCLLSPTDNTVPPSGLTFVWSVCQGIPGCLDASACNFNPQALCSDGSCTYCNCESNSCGCTDAEACNYDAQAAFDDGSCSFDCFGCTDSNALNFSATATQDDGTCYFAGSGISCDSAIELTCDMTEIVANTELIETIMPYSNNCGTVSGIGYWYAYTAPFNSQLTISTVHPATDFDTYISVFGGTCNALSCLVANDDSGGNFQSIVTFNAMAGTTYYILMRGFSTMTGTYGMVFDCGGGCLDPEACNYNADAPFDNGSCLYGADCYGCTDPEATNYNEAVVYDNGSCTYSIDLVVFYDMNMDGERQVNEPGMANWPIYVGGLQATLFTNADGRVDVTVPSSPFVVELQNNTDNWISTTPTQQMVVVPSNAETQFGLAPSTGEAFVLAGPIDGFWDIIHCTEGLEDGVYINNTGSVPLNGTITLVCDEMFTPEADVFGTVAPDLTGPGFAQWNIVELLPGQNQLYSFHIAGPGFDVIGDEFTFLYDVVLYDQDGVQFFDTEYQTESFVACSYDPNDIAATPEGYAEPHFILTGERIQYRVRFQNTGNLPAEDVVIIDALDPSVFNMSTFVPMYGSASFTSCLHDDGTLDFIFEDIFLPDSASNEEGSHGFVVFSIELQPGLAPGTVINNYVDIYFEQNPAITTNTVFHTIFDCSSFVAPAMATSYCSDDVVVVDNTQMYVENYAWLMDGETLVTTPQSEWSNLADGSHELEWFVENPLCGMEGSITFDVLAAPAFTVGDDVEACVGSTVYLNAIGDGEVQWSNGLSNGSPITIEESGVFEATATSLNGCTASESWSVTALELPSTDVVEENGVLIAQDGAAWQWYLNGQAIEGATSSALSLFSEGAFAVLVTNAEGCSAMSDDILVGGVGAELPMQVQLYPHPVVNVSILQLPAGKHTVDVMDASGRLVKSYGWCMGQIEMEASTFEKGIYFVHVKNENSAFTMKTIIE